jgi:hypothetical protein
MRRSLFLVIPIVMADPCTDLCNRDGPAVCTKGSWTKPNGYCQNYLYRGDPANKDICYHTKETAATCPSSGTGVKASEAAEFLGNRGQVQTSVVPSLRSADTTATPSTERQPDVVYLYRETRGYLLVRRWISFFPSSSPRNERIRSEWKNIVQQRDPHAFDLFVESLREWRALHSDGLVQGRFVMQDFASFPIFADLEVITTREERTRAVNVFCGESTWFQVRASLDDVHPFERYRPEALGEVIDYSIGEIPEWVPRLCSAALALQVLGDEARF